MDGKVTSPFLWILLENWKIAIKFTLICVYIHAIHHFITKDKKQACIAYDYLCEKHLFITKLNGHQFALYEKWGRNNTIQCTFS